MLVLAASSSVPFLFLGCTFRSPPPMEKLVGEGDRNDSDLSAIWDGLT